MALISFGYRIDMFAIDPPLEVGAYIVAYDLDGVLKQKDHLGVVTLVGAGAGGPQGPPGPVGPAGLTWSGAWVATQSYSLNYAVGYGSASWWCISPITGSPSNPGPDVDTTHWALLAAQGSPGSQGGTGSQGLQGSQGPIGINWIGDWIINVYDVRDAVYYNGSSYVCIASTVGTETLSPDTNTACWDIISLKGDVGPQGATGSPGVSGATGSTLQDIFYNIGGTVSATNSTSAIYRTGSLNIGTGTASNSRFVVSSSGGTTSLVVDENGSVYNRDKNGIMSNIAFGLSASLSNTTGVSNTAFGNGALLSNTNKSYNIAIGANSLFNNNADYNIGIGSSTLFFNTTGTQNTGIGAFSLFYNVSGSFNTGIGIASLQNGTQSQRNTGIGGYSLYNTRGSRNIGIGFFGGSAITTGNDNTIIGSDPINNTDGLTTGSNNTLIGKVVTGITVGDNNTILGRVSGLAAGLTNSVILADGVGNIRFYSDNKGNVGLGTTSPSTKLHVFATQSGAFRLEDGTQGNGYILISDANGVATWTASTYALDSNVVHKTGNESISGIKTFTNTGVLTNVVVQNYNTNPSSSALLVEIGNPGMGIKSENLSSGIGIYSNSTSTGLNYVGANNGVTTFSVDKTGAVSIGTGTASDSRFVVSSSGGTTSFYVNEAGDSVFRGDTKIIGATFSPSVPLPPGSITFGSKTAIYPPGDNEIVIGTDTLFRYGWKFTSYQITNLWGNTIEFQNIMGTIGNLFVGSTYQFAGYNVFSPSQQSTLFVKGTTASIMRVVGTGATWSNSQSIFEINNSGAVSVGTSQSMSGSKLFIQSNTASTTIGSNVMLDLYNGQSTGTPGQVSELAFSADAGGGNPYNTQHRYAVISGYAVNWNNVTTGGGIKFSTRATTGSSLVTSLVVDQNGSVYNDARGSNTLYGFNALLVSTGINNTAIGSSALQNNLGGLLNTAVGMSSMASNTSGNYNTAVGAQAMTSNVLGNDNTAIGIGSQQLATQSSSNVSVGRSTLYNNLSSGSVAIGIYALTTNTLGLYNTAVGTNALSSNSTVVSTLNISNGGSGYTMSSTFSNVQLLYISGSTATTYPIVTVYVGAGGTVSTVTLVTNGSGFKDTTTVMGANLGTGVTFSVSVSSLNSGDSNTAVGYQSLSSNITGDSNTAVGYQSLYSNTTGFNNTTLGFQSLSNNTTGTNSVAIGYQALYNNTTGHDNVAIGYRALYFNEVDNFARPGRFNVAIGSSALYINESGKYNVAIGHQALYSNEVDNNVALGYQSLYTNYNGDNNVAIGSLSLFSNYSGSQNTAIGRISLWSNTTGSGNVAVGHQALYNNTTGGQNVGLGVGTLNANTTGTYNTALGYAALQANISGSYNIAIGNQAGYFNSLFQLATSSNNSIFIGYDTKPQLSNQTNQVVIGHGATGNGSNSFTLGNDSITKTIVKGNVGIGLTGPSTKLHVYATQSGAFRLEDGTQGSGRVLTSDANGFASWTSTVAVITTTSSITTNTLDNNGLSQMNKCVIIDNGTYSISLTVDATSGFNSTYLKHGTASISFVQGSGRTLVQVDGTLVLNGSVGSSATIISYGTTDYLRVNNA